MPPAFPDPGPRSPDSPVGNESAVGQVLAEMARESGATGIILCDEAGMLLRHAGPMGSQTAETLAVLAVNAFVAAREVARLAALGAPGEFWQRALCGGYGVMTAGQRHRLVVVHDSAHAEGAVAFAARRHLPRLMAALAEEDTRLPPLSRVPVPFQRETSEDARRFSAQETSWKEGMNR